MNIKILVHIGLVYFVKKNEIVYIDSFGVEHIPEEIKKCIGNRNIKANIYRVQAVIQCVVIFVLNLLTLY